MRRTSPSHPPGSTSSSSIGAMLFEPRCAAAHRNRFGNCLTIPELPRVSVGLRARLTSDTLAPMGVVRYLAPDTDAYVASVQRHAGEFEAATGHRLEVRVLASDEYFSNQI